MPSGMHPVNSEIVGTWFPTGFHGHYRSRTRNDFMIPYRHRAKPHPPSKFLDRTQMRSENHLFSKHDNRNSHASTMGDLEMHFSHGLGKRKSTGNTQHAKNTSSLLTWSSVQPSKSDQISSYRSGFNLPLSRSCDRFINEVEPIHSRSNHNLHRRQVRAMTSPPSMRTAPLLAWNEADYSYAKPCVATPHYRSVDNRVLSRGTSNSDMKTNVSNGHGAGNENASMVVETVTPLNLSGT